MKSLFFIESKDDIDRVRAYVKINAISSYEMYTVATSCPYFYDTFSCRDVESWANVDEFLHQRSYSWIYQYHENSRQLGTIPGNQYPYAQSLEFYLTMRYGMDYQFYSDYLTQYCVDKNVSQIFVNSLVSPYVAYLHEIRPLGSIKITIYEP